MENKDMINDELGKERQFLEYIKDIISKEKDNYLKQLNAFKKEIINDRKLILQETKRSNRITLNSETNMNETNYSRVYNKVWELDSFYNNPYFGKIEYLDIEFDEDVSVYIGKFGLMNNEAMEPLILDWRTPVASLFYQGKLGKLEYSSPTGRVKVDLARRKQYIIKNGNLEGMFDSELDVKDEILQMILSGKNSDKLKDIITTIQKEQDEVIRQPLLNNIVLNGVAGSGKTTIILHRIAYLLYNYREKLKNNVLIIGPNAIFMEYISDVLPDLGESEGSYQMTFVELAKSLLNIKTDIMISRDYFEKLMMKDEQFLNEIEKKSSLYYWEFIEGVIKSIEESLKVNLPIKFKGITVLSSEQINDLFFKQYKYLPVRKRGRRIKEILINKLRDIRNEKFREINTYYTNEIKSNSRDMIIQNNLYLERRERIKELLRESMNKKSEINSLYKVDTVESIYNAINGNRVLNEDDLACLLHLKHRIEGFDKLSIRHLVIDEAQDLSEYQFFVLRTITKCSSFTIVGDFNQRIKGKAHNSMMSNIKSLIKEEEIENTRFFNLHKSYRSTIQITEYSKQILNNKNIESLSRNGDEVTCCKVYSMDTLADYIIKEINVLKSKGYNKNAIICRNLKEIFIIESYIKSKLDLKIIDNEDVLLDTDIVLIPSYFAKGLEFDGVVVVDFINEYDSDDDLLKYIMCTRALHKLYHLIISAE